MANTDRYPEELLGDDEDNGTMPENVAELSSAVVGHRIVRVEENAAVPVSTEWCSRAVTGTALTLDDGTRVFLVDTDDCCAYTELKAFMLHPERVDHVITGVGTTDGYTQWHIYADLGDVLELTVGWSPGNPFYYGYGFNIRVSDPVTAD